MSLMASLLLRRTTYERAKLLYLFQIPPLSDWTKHYEVDDSRFTKDLAAFLTEHFAAAANANGKIFVLEGTNTDSKDVHVAPTLPEHELFSSRIEKQTLWWEIVECRVIKTEEELKLLKHVTKITSYVTTSRP